MSEKIYTPDEFEEAVASESLALFNAKNYIKGSIKAGWLPENHEGSLPYLDRTSPCIARLSADDLVEYYRNAWEYWEGPGAEEEPAKKTSAKTTKKTTKKTSAKAEEPEEPEEKTTSRTSKTSAKTSPKAASGAGVTAEEVARILAEHVPEDLGERLDGFDARFDGIDARLDALGVGQKQIKEGITLLGEVVGVDRDAMVEAMTLSLDDLVEAGWGDEDPS